MPPEDDDELVLPLLLDEVLLPAGVQSAVWSALMLHSKPSLHPQITQLPTWHWLSLPQVSLTPQSAELVQPDTGPGGLGSQLPMWQSLPPWSP